MFYVTDVKIKTFTGIIYWDGRCKDDRKKDPLGDILNFQKFDQYFIHRKYNRY